MRRGALQKEITLTLDAQLQLVPTVVLRIVRRINTF